KKDYEREETEGLERNTRDVTGERTSLENAENGIGITARVVGDDSQHAVDKAEQAHRDACMAAIIEQREELFIQPAERSNAEDDVQENESRRTERANQQNFVRDEREPQFGENTEENEKRAYAADEHELVNPLLPVPLDCTGFEAHVLLSLSTLLHNERLRCRHYFMAGQAVEHELAGFAAHIRRDGKWSV